MNCDRNFVGLILGFGGSTIFSDFHKCSTRKIPRNIADFSRIIIGNSGGTKIQKNDDLGEGVEAGARGERKELRAAGLLRRGLEHRHGLPARPLALVQDGVHLQADEQGC